MRILVDGDACPVKKEIENIALKYSLDVIYYLSVSHYSFDKMSENVIYLDNIPQAVDIRIMNDIRKQDILVTDDYGLACAVLDKCYKVVSSKGSIYSKDNIELLLYQRHLSQEQRKRRIKISNIKKRTEIHNEAFYKTMVSIIENSALRSNEPRDFSSGESRGELNERE